MDNQTSAHDRKWGWLYDILLVLVLLAASVFRFTGVNWGELQHQHPDEDFFTSVTAAIQPVHSPEQYFNTATSTLNPYNVGYGFYVYGTLPIFMVRYMADWLGQLGNLRLFGRWFSGAMDLGTVVLLYFLVRRLYGRRAALLAAAFSACAVMQIQQSHFYTTDNFVTFFMTLTLLVAVFIATGKWAEPVEAKQESAEEEIELVDGEQKKGAWISSSVSRSLSWLFRNRLTWLSVAFGMALGMAAASKISAVVLAVALPAALAVRYFRKEEGPRSFDRFLASTFIFMVIGGVVALLSFRVFQPYAFSGLGLNPAWLQNLRELRSQASGDADMPWNLQWARRSHLFSFENLTVWGLGLPLGVLAWAGFLWMGWRILKGEWRQHILVWGWMLAYFLWQSLQFNATMRYQLPVYPLLCMMAAWAVFRLAGGKVHKLEGLNLRTRKLANLRTIFSAIIGVTVLILTICWAYAFTSIYTRTEPRIAASNWIYQNIPGPLNLRIQQVDGTTYQQPLPIPAGATITTETPYATAFIAQRNGLMQEIFLAHVADSSGFANQTLNLSLTSAAGETLAIGSVTANFAPITDTRGAAYTVQLSRTVSLLSGQTYMLQITTTGGTILLTGASFANETDYDYGLPFRLDGYDPFGGIYRGDLNFQIYWPDNADKLTRYLNTLDASDYILIPTNHQYGQTTRIPERYPLTTTYYRELLGCPADKDIIWCYYVAEPGMFKGSLGFELVATFEDYPTLGPITINDQFAEEAFTFYDHPKVLIFKKTADYNSAHVQTILGAVDLSHVVQLTPRAAGTYKSLMLPADQLAVQQAGGTWSQLFDWDALQNKVPALGVVLWYLVILALGLFTYPIVRAALPGLADHGYPLARVAGLLLWAWLAWLAGSVGLTYSRPVIAAALGVILLVGAWQAWRQREELKSEWKGRWKYFLLIEGIFLAFFLLDFGIRLGNPDLWHMYKGGERPMDFSYFNAVLKSTTFPPYDPWFAGGYINYYYYGYVIVGTPVKLLGIVPSIAYNLLLPTLFACLAVSAFSVGYNLVKGQSLNTGQWSLKTDHRSLLTGFFASAAVLLLGNLGVVRMFYQGFQRLAAPGGIIDKANIFQRLFWTGKGFVLALGGANLPFIRGNFYWDPSRVLPDASGSPITEFPLFTFLYSDLHAHMIAMMVTVLAIAWTLSVLLAKAKWTSRLDAAVGLFLGGLTIGALRPTNTWDFYTYLVLALVVMIYAILRYADVDRFPPALANWPGWLKRLLLAIGAAAILTGLSLLLYQPFSHWFGQAYNSAEAWTGGRSNIFSYLTHWGVFLFFIVSWMTWETRNWMAETPVSALRKLRPWLEVILAALGVIVLVLIGQQVWVMLPSQNVPWSGITILWLALPLAVWAAVLLFRPGQPDSKRLVLFMVGTSLLLTMFVELFTIRGDIGRMNTVFKFYLQAWIMLGLSAAAAVSWLLPEVRKWLPGWRGTWQVAAGALVLGAALFLLIGGMDKVRDRSWPDARRSIDSMAYMQDASYADFGVTFPLDEDYRAIRWLQENVQGSPVIVEANCPEYRWCSRFTIYTGLPGVLGWNWHQRQQRAYQGEQVWDRVSEINAFYATTDLESAQAFLRKYNVRYIIVGRLERAEYIPGAPNGPVPAGSPDGLLKFEQFNGIFWREVYRDGQTVIYEVLP
jgi:YYY domain-containing protein